MFLAISNAPRRERLSYSLWRGSAVHVTGFLELHDDGSKLEYTYQLAGV